MSSFTSFWGTELDSVLQNAIAKIKNEINEQTDDYILNINSIEYITYLTNKYKFETLDIHFEDISVSSYEKQIPADDFPYSFIAVREGKSYPKDVIKYHLPFIGNEKLIHYKTNPFLTWTPNVTIEDSCICFEIINFYNNTDSIKKEAESNIKCIRDLSQFANNQINSFNMNLQSQIQSLFMERKKHLLQKYDLVASLGVPIRGKTNVSSTFTIPSPSIREIIRVSPPVTFEKGFKPEPTLDDSIYQAILNIIQNVGKQFERMPSTYINKSEESLRDHILLQLEPNFEGSATGETFNKTGKTDILLRYNGNNVFIAECKYWTGKRGYLKTISQLLSYLNWRDSKSSVIMFVKNKDFTSVIKKVIEVTSTHPNYLGFVDKKEDTWLSFRFHINGDANREVKLAVMLFHIP